MKKYRILRNAIEVFSTTYAFTVMANTPEEAKEALENDDFLDVEMINQDILETIEEDPDVDITEISDN